MGKYGDISTQESKVKITKQKFTKEIIIPRSKREISEESWNKTLEKAHNISLNTCLKDEAKTVVIKKVEENTLEITKYLQELQMKNDKLLKNTKESLQFYQEFLKKELLEKEVRQKERKEKEVKENEQKEQIKKEQKEKEQKEIFEKEQKAKVILETKKEIKKEEKTAIKDSTVNNTSTGLHSVQGRVVSAEAYKEGDLYMQKILNVKKTKQEMNTPFIFKGKMSIRTRCGQFMNLQSKVIEIAKIISSLLEEGKKESLQIYNYLMYLVAKQVVKQAQTEIAVKKDLAFPIAIFCCMLMEKHLDFKDYLIGKMMTKCPYIVPMYIKKGTSTDAEYRKNLGYIKKEDGSYETEIQYEERMCGVVCLYAAIVQTTALPHSYGIQNGWKWLSRILNLPVRRITASLILSFIETAGYEMYKTYPTQMPKLMKLLLADAIPNMPEASVASITRLQLFLDDTVVKTGSIPEPFGKHLKRK